MKGKGSTKLNRLIASLTPSQKGYVTKWLSKWQPKSYSLLLFDYLTKNPEATADDIKRFFKSKGIRTNIPALKHKLYESILEAIAVQGKEQMPFSYQQLRKLMLADALVRQKMYDEALSYVKKMITESVAEGNHTVALGALHLFLRMHNMKKFSNAEIEFFKDSGLKLLGDIDKWINNAFVLLMAYNIYRQQGKMLSRKDQKSIESLEKQLRKPDKQTSFLSYYLYVQTLILIKGISNQYNDVHSVVLNFMKSEVMERKFMIFRTQVSAFLVNALIIIAEMNNSSKCKYILSYLDNLLHTTSRSHPSYKEVLQNFVAANLFFIDKFSCYSDIDNKLVSKADELIKLLPNDNWFSLYTRYTIGKILLINKEYKQAERFLQFFDEAKKRNAVGADIISFGLLLNAILAYETGNIKKLELTTRKAKYHLRKNGLLTDFIKELVAFLHRSCFRDVTKSEVIKLLDLTDTQEYEEISQYFPFRQWLKNLKLLLS